VFGAALTRARRGGFSLAELTVVLAVGGLILTLVLGMVVSQQRFYTRNELRVNRMSQLRQIQDLLPADLRAISTSDTLTGSSTGADVYAWNDHAFEFRSLFGSSLLCWITSAAARNVVRLPPTQTPAQNVLTGWLTPPIVGDSLLIFDESTSFANGRWRLYTITDIVPVSGAAGCPWGTGNFLTVADTASSSYQLSVTPNLMSTVTLGAPVRMFRRARYELVQASDSTWSLHYFDCSPAYPTANHCNSLERLAGPLMAYSNTPAASGLAFTYYDSANVVLNPSTAQPRRLARIAISVRGVTSAGVGMSGNSISATIDSLNFSVAVRNRN
jgi:prepilin-type N-terminal cleavage/methylation domain-containing protein